MFDNTNGVPSRIVINGTAKMRLSDRFKQLSAVKPSVKASHIHTANELFEGCYKPLPRAERPTRFYINPIHHRFNYARREPRYDRALELPAYYDAPDYEENRFRRPQRFHMPPINQRISFKRENRDPRPPRFFPGAYHSKRPASFHQRPWKFGRSGGSRQNRGRGRQRGFDVRHKPTLEELDRELELYMRSGKHPRVYI